MKRTTSKKNVLLRVLSVMLCMALLCCVFSACQSQKDTPSDSSKPSESSPASSDTAGSSVADASNIEESGAPEETREIVVMMFCATDPTDKQMVLDEVNKLLEEKIHVTIKDLILVNSANYKNQLTLMLSGKERIDAYFESYAGRSDYFGHVRDGLIMPMDELLPEYGQGIIDELGMEVIEGAAVNGSIYGVPGVHEWAAVPAIQMRKDLVDKYSIDLDSIKTPKDFEEVLKTIKDNEPEVYPMFISDTNARNSSLMMWLGGDVSNVDHFADQYGVLLDATSASLELENIFATDAYRKACETLHDWYEKGYIYPDVLTASDQRQALFQAGRLFCMNSSYKPGMENQLSGQFGYEMVSFFPEGAVPLKISSIQYSNFWSIPYYSEEPEAAMKFINELYTNKDLYALLTSGIEGVHYVKNDDGTVSYAEGLTATTTGYPMASLSWAWGNQYLAPVWEGDDPDLYTQLKDFNDSAVQSSANGFVFNTAPVAAEVSALANVITEYQASLETGVADPEVVLPEFLQKLEAAGLEDVIAEKQKQLTDWGAQR